MLLLVIPKMIKLGNENPLHFLAQHFPEQILTLEMMFHSNKDEYRGYNRCLSEPDGRGRSVGHYLWGGSSTIIESVRSYNQIDDHDPSKPELAKNLMNDLRYAWMVQQTSLSAGEDLNAQDEDGNSVLDTCIRRVINAELFLLPHYPVCQLIHSEIEKMVLQHQTPISPESERPQRF